MSTPEIRARRVRLAKKFLLEVLVTEIEKGTSPLQLQPQVHQLHANFVQENQGIGDDFDLMHVGGQCIHIILNWMKENDREVLKFELESYKIVGSILVSLTSLQVESNNLKYKQ